MARTAKQKDRPVGGLFALFLYRQKQLAGFDLKMPAGTKQKVTAKPWRDPIIFQ